MSSPDSSGTETTGEVLSHEKLIVVGLESLFHVAVDIVLPRERYDSCTIRFLQSSQGVPGTERTGSTWMYGLFQRQHAVKRAMLLPIASAVVEFLLLRTDCFENV